MIINYFIKNKIKYFIIKLLLLNRLKNKGKEFDILLNFVIWS